MIKTFTQEKAVEDKKKQLQKIIDGTLSPKELASMITDRRLNWLEENRHLLNGKCTLEEAYRLMIYYHMKVEDGISISRNGSLLKIKCMNFCPYLEASRILGLDTRFVCREIGEPSLKAFFNAINSRFHFGRDYSQIRPYSDYCLEVLEEI